MLEQFLREAPKRLRQGGLIYVSNSGQIGDRPLFLNKIKKSNLKAKQILSIEHIILSNMLHSPVTKELFVLSPKL